MQRNKVFVTVPRAAITPVMMDEHEWLFIQGQNGKKLNGKALTPEVRKRLLEVTSLYASSLRSPHSVEPLKEVLNRIEALKRQTDGLRSYIWKESKAVKSELLYWQDRIDNWDTNLAEIQERLLCIPRTELESQFPLALLDRALKGSILVAKLVQHELREDAGTSDDRNLWFLWAALVFVAATALALWVLPRGARPS